MNLCGCFFVRAAGRVQFPFDMPMRAVSAEFVYVHVGVPFSRKSILVRGTQGSVISVSLESGFQGWHSWISKCERNQRLV